MTFSRKQAKVTVSGKAVLELSFAHENGMALGPQLTVANLAEHWSTDMEPAMGLRSNRLEGLWWSTGKQTEGRLVLSNSLNEPLTVQMNVDYQDKQLSYPALHLSSHQTILLAIDETVNGRASTDNVNFFVQIPTSLSVVSVSNLPDGSGTQDGCPPGSFGIKVKVTYQVKDQTGAALQSDRMEPQEKVTSENLNGTSLGDPVPNFTDIGPSRITGTSQFTDSNGQFLDAPFGNCQPFVISSYSFTQNIRVLASNQNPYNLRTHTVNLTGTTAGHGTLTNGSDVQSSRP